MEGFRHYDQGLRKPDHAAGTPYVEAPADNPISSAIGGTPTEITAPGSESLPPDLYYDHSGPLPSSVDSAETIVLGEVPARTPRTVWEGPWRPENFPGGPQPQAEQKPERRDWRDPLPPPEPPQVVPLLERLRTPHQRAVDRERRIGRVLRRVQKRLGLLE
jgi:hypothetical protein